MLQSHQLWSTTSKSTHTRLLQANTTHSLSLSVEAPEAQSPPSSLFDNAISESLKPLTISLITLPLSSQARHCHSHKAAPARPTSEHSNPPSTDLLHTLITHTHFRGLDDLLLTLRLENDHLLGRDLLQSIRYRCLTRRTPDNVSLSGSKHHVSHQQD